MPYAIGRTGLIHDPQCRVLGKVAWTTPDRQGALRVGARMAKCCMGGRVATRPGQRVVWSPRKIKPASAPPARRERPLA